MLQSGQMGHIKKPYHVIRVTVICVLFLDKSNLCAYYINRIYSSFCCVVQTHGFEYPTIWQAFLEHSLPARPPSSSSGRPHSPRSSFSRKRNLAILSYPKINKNGTRKFTTIWNASGTSYSIAILDVKINLRCGIIILVHFFTQILSYWQIWELDRYA